MREVFRRTGEATWEQVPVEAGRSATYGSPFEAANWLAVLVLTK